MGYLVTIKYYEPNKDDGFGFDTSVEKEKTIRVGKQSENVERDVLAAVILKQASRMDMMITGINVIEFVKKEINVKRSRDGVVIGNKKFVYDDSMKVTCTVEDSEQPQEPIIAPVVSTAMPPTSQSQTPNNPSNNTARPTKTTGRFEYFTPEDFARAKPRLWNRLQQQKMKPGKQYEIFEERFRESDGETMFIVQNENNELTAVESSLFSAAPPGIMIDMKTGLTEKQGPVDELPMPGGEYQGSMPNLRG